MKIAVVQTNLNPISRTRYLAQIAEETAANLGATTDFIDMIQHTLPFCDGAICYSNPAVQDLTLRLKAANAIIIVSPIYNYDLNAVAKNLLELTNDAWKEKVVGFIVQAGGGRSYMAPGAFATSLMLDHGCHLVPRYAYIERRDFVDGTLPLSGEPRQRVCDVILDAMHLYGCLLHAPSTRQANVSLPA